MDGQRQLRVLVVDDEPNIIDVVSMALRHHGFEVDAAETGAGRWHGSVICGRT